MSGAAIAAYLPQKKRSKNVIVTINRAGRVTLEDVTAGRGKGGPMGIGNPPRLCSENAGVAKHDPSTDHLLV